MDKYTRQDVEIIEKKKAYRGFFQIDVLRLRHRLFSGEWNKPFSRELFKRRDAVGVLLYDAKLDAVGLIEQFRVGAYGNERAKAVAGSPWLLELVAGIIDENETPESTACRESLEEAGVSIEQLQTIAKYYVSPGGSNEYFYLFAGKADLSHATGIHGLEGENEDIRVHVIPAEQLIAKLVAGDIDNAQTIIAAQWLQANHHHLKQLWVS